MHEVRQAFKVMTYDIDFAGVLSNIVYIRWLEDLRNLFAEQALSLGNAMARGLAATLTRTEIDYRHAVRFPDVVDGRMWLESAERVRYVLAAEFVSRVTQQVSATARQTGVFVSIESGRPVRLPEEYRAVTG